MNIETKLFCFRVMYITTTSSCDARFPFRLPEKIEGDNDYVATFVFLYSQLAHI